jgi:hypothetical protein
VGNLQSVKTAAPNWLCALVSRSRAAGFSNNEFCGSYHDPRNERGRAGIQQGMKYESDHGTLPNDHPPLLRACCRPLLKLGRKVTGGGTLVGRVRAGALYSKAPHQ